MRAYDSEMMIKVLKKLAKARYDDGNPVEALSMYQRAQHFDHYDEAVHVGIMRCLAAMKDASGVQQQYKLLIQTLRELEIAQPSSEAIEIYRASFK